MKSRIGKNVDEVDRGAEGIAEANGGVRDARRSDIDREGEVGLRDEVLLERRDCRCELNRSESFLERSDGSGPLVADDERVTRNSLDEVLEEELTSCAGCAAGGLVVDRGRDDVLAGNKDEVGDVCGADGLAVERESESDVAGSDRDVGGVEEMGVDCDGASELWLAARHARARTVDLKEFREATENVELRDGSWASV